MKSEGEHIGSSTRRSLVTLVGVASAEWSQKQDSVGWDGTGRQGWRREVPTTGFREKKVSQRTKYKCQLP